MSEVLATLACSLGCDHEMTDEMVWTLLCGAFEGGSNYWIDSAKIPDYMLPKSQIKIARIAKANGEENPFPAWEHMELPHCIATDTWRYSHQIPFLKDGNITIIVGEGGYNGETHFPLNMDAILSGIRSLDNACRDDGTPNRHLTDWISENHDSTTSDVFLQHCLFGEVVFG